MQYGKGDRPMKITIHNRPDEPAERRFEAVALVPELPGPADRHSVGSSAQEATDRLREYVAYLLNEEAGARFPSLPPEAWE